MAKEINYKELGFKCGIETHQQLEGKKLFCDCPTLNIREGGEIKVLRKLRAVIGETGEIDKAAAEASAKGKSFHYLGDSKDVCLVDIDEEPPHPINQEAVKTVLIVAKLLNAKIVDEIQVMRKTVVDGSNTSGFQRTALVAYDGYIKTSKGKIRIPTIFLEEEACQKLKETKDSVSYRLDRLGIPLIEIATEPDIVDNEHAKETAEKIGMILRSTGRVKRGIGTIRQDINVSIKKRKRVEIKGVQNLGLIAKTIEQEIKRQRGLIEENEKFKSEVRKALPDGK
ncbi:Glu-tRNA(Gln) amidotransferase subunit GatE, partial [Candidatus Woesearchaeota archaeon]|nr:Glu-tRNA(Gln) amidotransferase subunit GatE [Candidatus Woesearchaeota archaeon]